MCTANTKSSHEYASGWHSPITLVSISSFLTLFCTLSHRCVCYVWILHLNVMHVSSCAFLQRILNGHGGRKAVSPPISHHSVSLQLLLLFSIVRAMNSLDHVISRDTPRVYICSIGVLRSPTCVSVCVLCSGEIKRILESIVMYCTCATMYVVVLNAYIHLHFRGRDLGVIPTPRWRSQLHFNDELANCLLTSRYVYS